MIQFDKNGQSLLFLLLYIFISLPFVYWPGSVIRFGFENLFKGLIFYFLTVLTVLNERRLRILIYVFVGCQVFRVIEPLYLHMTAGYWGDIASFEGGGIMDRLAGSPYDVINSNGLAYVALTSITFLYYLSPTLANKLKLSAYLLIFLMLYGLVLTGSRSGMVALAGLFLAIIMKSRRKVLLLVVVLVMVVFTFRNLDEVQRERYLSIYRDDVRGASTARGRIEGLYRDMEVVMNRPIFGHGLGTSLEANYNIGGSVFRSHNLVLEILQEIGLVGFSIFMYYIFTSINIYLSTLKNLKRTNNKPLLNMTKGLGAWLLMNILFGIFSYGLSSYSWYLFGGLTAVLLRLSANNRLIVKKRVLAWQRER